MPGQSAESRLHSGWMAVQAGALDSKFCGQTTAATPVHLPDPLQVRSPERIRSP